jgi:hypothetical protein
MWQSCTALWLCVSRLRLLTKLITSHGYTLTDVHKITVLTHWTYKVIRITKHYLQHLLQTWRMIVSCRNVLRDNLTDMGIKSLLFAMITSGVPWKLFLDIHWYNILSLFWCGECTPGVWLSFLYTHCTVPYDMPNPHRLRIFWISCCVRLTCM